MKPANCCTDQNAAAAAAAADDEAHQESISRPNQMSPRSFGEAKSSRDEFT